MKKLYTAVAALLVLAALEGLFTLYLHYFGEPFRFPEPERYLASPEAIRAAQQTFDPKLGWRNHYATSFGERPRARERGRPVVAAFGDSFVHGDEVGHGETWTEALAEHLGGDVYNFGASADGMDQALLRMERDLTKVDVPVALLGFISPDAERNVGVYWKFMYPRDDMALVKPRFVLEDGRLRLLPNPVPSAESLPELLVDPEFLRRLGEHDFWYNRHDLPAPTFPRLRLLFHRGFFATLVSGTSDPWQLEEPRAVAVAILERFARSARAAGAEPVFAHLPVAWEMSLLAEHGREPLAVEVVRGLCERHGWRYVTPIDAARGMDSGAIAALFTQGLAGGHYTPAGNLWISDKLKPVIEPLLNERQASALEVSAK